MFMEVWQVLAGCGKKEASPTALVEGRAAVEAVIPQVLDGGESQIVVRGSLPDGCTQLGQLAVSRGGSVIAVILPVYRDQAAENCAGPQPFEQAITLGRDLAPGRYSISVNGVQAIMILPEPQATATPSATTAPSSTATAAPTETVPTPAATPTRQPTELPVVEIIGDLIGQADSEACIVKGAFVEDVTVPDGSAFDPGDRFTKTWRVRNAGSCVWQGYSLVFQRGDLMGSQETVPLPGPVSPGSPVDISIDFTVPQTQGSYFSDWLLSTANGQAFGLGNPPVGLLWLKIGVRMPMSLETGPVENPPEEAAGPPDGAVCEYRTDPEFETEVLVLINKARQEHGLDPLQLVAPLSAAARGHSADMACHDFVEHYGYDGSTWQKRIKAQGVSFRWASENIYAGNPAYGSLPQSAFNWWMNSQVHRDNILTPRIKQIGVGYAFFSASTYKGYFTLNFIDP